MSTRSIRYVPRSRQRGSMTVAVVFAVLVGLVLLGVAQLGYGYYMKREVQKAADLAALSAVQVLGTGAAADCSRAKAAGVSAALANLPNILDTFSAADVTVDCKLWDPTRPPVGGMPLFDPASGQLPNAMRVRIGKTLGNVIPSAFVGGDTVVSVQAVATSTQPVAAFTVGSRLLRLEKGGLCPRSWPRWAPRRSSWTCSTRPAWPRSTSRRPACSMRWACRCRWPPAWARPPSWRRSAT